MSPFKRILVAVDFSACSRAALDQAMNGVIDRHFEDHPDERQRSRIALGKILDLELAIMLHTYREDLLSQQARVERLATFGQLVVRPRERSSQFLRTSSHSDGIR